MFKKINRNRNNTFNLIILLILIIFLIFTRFFNLSWSLPYPMHPDERNMAIALQQLDCQWPKISFDLPKNLFLQWKPVYQWISFQGDFNLKECFNPHFFAYGQLPLYLGYLLSWVFRSFVIEISSTLVLRIISAFFSVLTGIFLFKIIEIFLNKKDYSDNIFPNILKIVSVLIIVFPPYGIQLAHFGTTESLLMFFYVFILYKTLLYVERKISLLKYVIDSGIILGLALGTKISSLIFITIPLLIIFSRKKSKFPSWYIFFSKIFDVLILLIISLIFFIISSPHNFINFQDFLGAITYEKDVALGKYLVFYTRQFQDTIPILFQIEKIFPYALGLPIFILAIFGFFLLSFKDKKINILRIGFLSYFFVNSFIFVKWTRFMAPVFPLLLIFSILFLAEIVYWFSLTIVDKKKNFFQLGIFFVLLFLIVFYSIIPGLKYFQVYQQKDTRIQATEWINKNIPANSYVLSETANVVDIPLINKKNLQIISFNFYDLDNDLILQEEFKNHLQKADYIFIPSRRVFANHTCEAGFNSSFFSFLNKKCENLKKNYPLLNEYYANLFSGKLGFKKIAEFSVGLDDEQAEETWSVFDHPVIRVYKKI